MQVREMSEADLLSYLADVGEQIRTQDNQCTSDPLFVVQEQRRILGIDSDYSEDYVWLHEYDHEYEAEEAEAVELDERWDAGLPCSGWDKIHFIELWQSVTVCFTARAAEAYIEANRHNLRNPRVYVDSAYRNAEIQAIRKFLMQR
jgi:hypothetical protein